MIKLGRFFYIHWLFLILMVFCFINRKLEIMFISYLIMLIHEVSHLVAAKYLGLSVSHIVFYPFGINLRLKNTILYSITDEIILYASGPVSNIIMALLSLPFIYESSIFTDIYYKNISLFIINILPLVPLDGGMIIKRLCNYRFGFDTGNRIMKTVSFVILVLVLAFCGQLLYLNKFNSSLCIFIAFIVGNIFVTREKYNLNLIKELLYNSEKKNNKASYKVKIIGAQESTDFIEIAKKFHLCSNYFVFLTDKNSSLKKILSEDEIIDNLLDNKNKIHTDG